MKKKLSIAVIAFVIIVGFYWFSVTSTKNNNEYRAKQLISAALPNYEIIKHFDTGIDLQGFIVAEKDKPQYPNVIFTSRDGNFIINGQVLAFDPETGKTTSMNERYVESFMGNEKADNLLKAVEQTTYIQQGSDDAPHQMYVIIDPDCKFCHALFTASQQAIQAGQLAVRWVVVGVVSSTSQTKAIAILNAPDPLKALMQNEDSFNYATDKGGIMPAENPTQAQAEALNKNISLLSQYVTGVPMIVYKNPQGFARIAGGRELPLTPAKIAEKDNTAKVNDFIILMGQTWK